MTERTLGPACPRECSGHLEPTVAGDAYECTRCDNELRQVVVRDIDSFRRVAESAGPAAPIARAALGLDPEGTA